MISGILVDTNLAGCWLPDVCAGLRRPWTFFVSRSSTASRAGPSLFGGGPVLRPLTLSTTCSNRNKLLVTGL